MLRQIGYDRELRARVILPPLAWIESRLDLSADPSSAVHGLVRLDPYQREPIASQFDPAIRRVVIMAIEQTGKSACWRFPLVYRLIFQPSPCWVIYESDDKAEDIHQESLEPLLRAQPELRDQIRRDTSTKRRMMLPNGAVLDFSGAGADITSKPRRDGVADELDTWPLSRAGIAQNLRNFAKRFRTYWARNEGCMVVVSSPKGEDSPIGDEFTDTDQGYWHLRCRRCGKLSIPSHAIHHLQWETTDSGVPVQGSIRLECPSCGHGHTEADAAGMNADGDYVRARPEITRYRGFQWGALACPRVFRWQDIAEAQMQAGKKADPETQANFDNSWRGLPFRPRKADKPAADAVRGHCAPPPDPSTLAVLLFAADTQDDGWYWVVRGFDARQNSYLLGHGTAKLPADIKAAWDAEYLGLRCEVGIIDHGGHGDRPKTVESICRECPGMWAYKGNSHIGTRWKPSSEAPRLLLANPYQYQADLLYYVHAQRNRENSYWFLPPTIAEEYVEHLAALHPDEKRRNGNRYENWIASNGAADHYFDAEKMLLVAWDFARARLSRWRIPVPWAGQKREVKRTEVKIED